MTKFFSITAGTLEHVFSIQDDTLVEERIAYYKFKASLSNTVLQDVKYKNEQNEWIPYIYDAQRVDAILNRFVRILPDSFEELALFEEYVRTTTDPLIRDDPLAFNKQCHNCGKPTCDYNNACNPMCDDLVYERSFECRLGQSCPICPFIIK